MSQENPLKVTDQSQEQNDCIDESTQRRPPLRAMDEQEQPDPPPPPPGG